MRTSYEPPLLSGLLSICRNRTHSAAEHLEVHRLFPSESWPGASTSLLSCSMQDGFALGFLSLLSLRGGDLTCGVMARRGNSPEPSLSGGGHSVNRALMFCYECAGLPQAG